MHLQFGHPDKIIVECVVKPDSTVKRELWLGRVWITVDGQVIGNVEDRFQEQIGIALGALLARSTRHWKTAASFAARALSRRGAGSGDVGRVR